ncbi:MAG: hypothetical protein Q9166_007629 [cf. Caloplaca sp. 2 TL-2023]
MALQSSPNLSDADDMPWSTCDDADLLSVFLVHPNTEGPFQVTHEQYLAERAARTFGTANPSGLDKSFWRYMVRLGGDAFQEPVWYFDRSGRTPTRLPDERITLVAGMRIGTIPITASTTSRNLQAMTIVTASYPTHIPITFTTVSSASMVATMVFPFTRLAAEVRQNILLFALYGTYDPEELRSALGNPNPLYPETIEAEIKLGHQILSSLRLTNRMTYHEANAASENWINYLELDLLEELEPIRDRLIKLAARFSDSRGFNRAADDAHNTQDSNRYMRIAQMELWRVHHHRRKLKQATNEVWVQTRTYEDGVHEFLDMFENKEVVEEEPEPLRQSHLERQLVVCFGPADAVTTRMIADGLPAGTRGIDGDHLYAQRIRKKRMKCLLTSKRSRKTFETSKERWQSKGDLPGFWWGALPTDWWRPYRT